VKLAQMQAAMFQAVTGEGALVETAALVHGGVLSPEHRIGIYAEMYWLRMRDSLRSDYPCVLRVLGNDDFDGLVARHLRRQPSTNYSLARLGNGLGETIRQAEPSLAWLPDLAELEWARAEAFVALDAPVLTPAALGNVTAETFAHVRVLVSPSLRLLTPAFDVLPVWRALEGGAPWQDLIVKRADSPLLVWRQGFAVFHVEVTLAEFQALSIAKQGLRLPAVCEAFAEMPEPAHAAFRAIGSWAAEGMLSALEVEP
jgi:hypothetical protein